MFYEYLISFSLAFIVTFAFTPAVKKFAFKAGAVDIPGDERRVHDRPMARLGGLAMVTGFLVTILYNIGSSMFNASGLQVNRSLIGLIIGVFIIVILGVFDDIHHLSAKVKLFVQIIAAILVVCISGNRIISITNPFALTGISELSNYISYPLTVIWIVGITNAINLIDGLDGLAAGVSSISYLSLFFISLLTGDINTAILTVTLAGATLGFLPYNFNPAKIFMGDTGATFLGFTLATISVQGALKSYTAISIAVPLLVLGLPLFDISFAIFRRLLSGKAIMSADRGHLHHRLIDLGLTHKQSVIVMYTVNGSLGLCAIVLANKGVLSAIILALSVSVFIIAGSRYMGEVHDSRHSHGMMKYPETTNNSENPANGG